MTISPSSAFAFSRISSIRIENAPSDRIMEDMAAGAFRALCDHLRQRGDRVQNMDLMTVGGFCRNCLAKWLVLEARKLSKELREDETDVSTFAGNDDGCKTTVDALDSFGYDEAAKIVYGESHIEWKKRHQKSATDVQLRLYKQSTHLHANHDEVLLKKTDGVNQEIALSERIMIRLQAGAFLSLCRHLRNRSDQVQNIDLMTVGGFCRNCLAKWLVTQARKMSNQIHADFVASSYFPDQHKKIIDSLDSFGYDEAAQYVYGCTYLEWKKLHQKEATVEQVEKYNTSKYLHASHDNEILATRSTKNNNSPSTKSTLHHDEGGKTCVGGPAQPNSLLSDVCCQDVDTLTSATKIRVPLSTNSIPRPPTGELFLRVGILTVSDRAAANRYETGDLSGPAVESTMVAQINQMNTSYRDQSIAITCVEKLIVPDEIPRIQEILERWSGKTADESNSSKEAFDLVFTTGGTGFAKRDVTPEATLAILDRECQGLMSWASMELTSKQPLATLSRAAAGLCGNTLIINLPGNPTGAAQVVELLFPLLLHAITDLRSSD